MMWYEIPGISGYRISHIAEILSLKGNEPRVLKQHPSSDGRYWQVRLWQDGKHINYLVHILMARTFLGPPPPGMEVCHGDGNGLRNTIDNLRWDTHSNNMLEAVRHAPHHESARTECDHGHDFTPENTMWRKDGERRYRTCRTCFNRRMRDYRREKRAKERAASRATERGCRPSRSP